MDLGRSEQEGNHGGAVHSGNGFVTLLDGSRRWGLFGAAGVLVRNVDHLGVSWYLVALRSPRSHLGGTWAVPGGALDLGESPIDGALREFHEEIGFALAEYELAGIYEDDHGGWSYWTALVDVAERFALPENLPWETAEVKWVPANELAGLNLFDAFRQTLRRLNIC